MKMRMLVILAAITFSATQVFALSLTADYWTLTHGNADVEILLEATGNSQSEFGLYFIEDNNIDNPVVVDTLKIFNTGDGGGVERKLLYNAGTGIYSVYNNNNTLFDTTDPASVGSVFGFYFISDGAQYSAIAGKTFYTDASLNWNNQDRIATHYSDLFEELVLYIEDEQKPMSDMSMAEMDEHVANMGIGGKQFDMKIGVDDIAPVPEPGTLLLLGSGLIGLAYLKRRKA